MNHPREWMEIRPEGLYCIPAAAFIDPLRPVARAIITHGHADHARSGHGEVFATPETLAIMRCRYGEACGERLHPLGYGTPVAVAEAQLQFAPAGHVLGSAQAVLEHGGARLVISGDYKRRADPTCWPFEPVACDVFVTEATFGLPVFTHPPIEREVAKLLDSLRLFAHRCHLVGVYGLGKCQRLICELRRAGYNKPLYLHGALVRLCELYQAHGIDLGEWVPVSQTDKRQLAGEIVLAPPSALADKWSRKLPDVLTVQASGWMQIRARARQSRVELPLVISDHADWNELLQTLDDVGAPEVWITHGRDDALAYAAQQKGYCAKALSILGYEDEES